MRQQFNCSNATELCDHCGKKLGEHDTGDYYCPVAKVRTITAFHCDFGCKVPSHQPGCPFYKGSASPTPAEPR